MLKWTDVGLLMWVQQSLRRALKCLRGYRVGEFVNMNHPTPDTTKASNGSWSLKALRVCVLGMRRKVFSLPLSEMLQLYGEPAQANFPCL